MAELCYSDLCSPSRAHGGVVQKLKNKLDRRKEKKRKKKLAAMGVRLDDGADGNISGPMNVKHLGHAGLDNSGRLKFEQVH